MLYAKNDITADVEEEGGTVTRQVAVAGQPISPAYDQYVDDKDTTTDPDVAQAAVSRATSARRAAERPSEVSHEEFRDTAAAGGAEAPRARADEPRPAARRRRA
jgi:hypothetical protein